MSQLSFTHVSPRVPPRPVRNRHRYYSVCDRCGRWCDFREAHHLWYSGRSFTTLQPKAQTQKWCEGCHVWAHPTRTLEIRARFAAYRQRREDEERRSRHLLVVVHRKPRE